MKNVFTLLCFYLLFLSNASSQNVGIGLSDPNYLLDVADRIRLRSGLGSAGIWFNNTTNDTLNGFVGTQNDINIAVYGTGVADWFVYMNTAVGNVGIGVAAQGTAGNARLILSRDNTGTCCGGENATLALAEATNVSPYRRPSISFHASGESEGEIELTQVATGVSAAGGSSRRLRFFDHQTEGLGLQLTGNLFYGNEDSRTQTRNDAGLQGNAGAQSGIYETSNPANFYVGASSWQHLLDIRHSNPVNNYAMQLSGSFFDQDMYMRKTNNSATTAWSRVQTSRDITFVKNEYYGVAAANAWNATTGYSAWMDVKSGDNIKLDGMYYGRLTGGNKNDYFYTNVEITGQNGCAAQQFANQHDYWHTTEDGADHDNFKPVPYMDVWTSNCTGQIRVRLWVYVGGDDNWETRENIITATRY